VSVRNRCNKALASAFQQTLEEARENLKDALQMVLEDNRELAEKEHKSTRREELVFI